MSVTKDKKKKKFVGRGLFSFTIENVEAVELHCTNPLEGSDWYEVRRNDAGALVTKRSDSLCGTRQITKEEWYEFLYEIFQGYRIHRWRKHYRFPFVFDPFTWWLQITFASGSKIVSSGEVRTPRYFGALCAAMEDLCVDLNYEEEAYEECVVEEEPYSFEE